MSDVVEHTDVVCPPKRTLAEQAEEGRVLPPADFFRLSEARLRNSPVFRQISARPLAKRGVRVVGTPQHLTKSRNYLLDGKLLPHRVIQHLLLLLCERIL